MTPSEPIGPDDELVVTALGAVGSFGDDVDALWSSLLAAEPLARPSAMRPDGRLSTEITGFDLARFYKSSDGHRRPNTSQYAMAAAVQAIAQARLDMSHDVARDDVAIVYATGTGGVSLTQQMQTALIERGMGAIEPLLFQESVFNAPASWVGIEHGFRGPLVALPMGWAAGGHAVAMAADLIRFGNAPIALVLVSDELAPIAFDAYEALGMLAPDTDGEQRLRPFDVRSRGTVLGEGAGAIVIETAASARARGVTPLARLAGWSITSDPSGIGPKRTPTSSLGDAMAQALALSGRSTVPAVFSGAWGAPSAAAVEADAIRALDAASAAPVVTSIRGALGEARGATSLWNVIAAVRALQEGVVPPLTGCEQPDTSLGLDLATAARTPDRLDAVLCNSFWVHGVNAAVVLEALS
jgi:3-oxoacyl-(acyl-carrier-protein) synthase